MTYYYRHLKAFSISIAGKDIIFVKAKDMPMRRPLTGIVLTVMLGNWSAAVFPFRHFFLITGAAVMLLAAGAFELAGRRKACAAAFCGRAAAVFLFFSIFLAAWVAAGLRIQDPSARTLPALMDRPREGVELVGMVGNDPVLFDYRGGRGCRFMFNVEGVRRIPQWQEAGGRVQVSFPLEQESRIPRYGERWRLAGTLAGSAGMRADGAWMDRAAAGARHQYTFRADSENSEFLSAGHGFIPLEWSFRMRHRAAESLRLGIGHRPDVVAILHALLLGYRQDIERSTADDFRYSGAYHILAISGIHVAIFALFIVAALGALGISRLHWFFFLAPCLAFFAMMTGMRPSTLRGTVMALLFFLGPLVHRKTDHVSALALAAFIILAISPLQLFDRGFILSFTVVAGLLAVGPRLIAYGNALTEPHPLRLEPAALDSLRPLARMVLACLAVSLAAWLTAFPLIARWFNLVTFAAPLSNMALVLPVPVILLAGWFSILFGQWIPALAEIFNFANVALVSFMISYVRFIARIPGARFFVETPPLWIVCLWYAGLAAWALKQKIALICCVAALAIAAAAGWIGSASTVNMEVVNIGGDAVCILNVPGSGALLINSGPRFKSGRLVRALRKKGVNRLHALVLTRAEAGHAGGATRVLREIPVRELWCASSDMRSPVFRGAIAEARSRGIPVREIAKGDSGELRSKVSWTALDPPKQERYRSAEEAALVLLFRRYDSSIIVAGTRRLGVYPVELDNGKSPAHDVLVGFEDGTNGRSWSAGIFNSRVSCVSRDHPCRVLGLENGRMKRIEAEDVMLRPGQSARIRLARDGARITHASAAVAECICGM